MTPLRPRFIEDLQLRGYAPKICYDWALPRLKWSPTNLTTSRLRQHQPRVESVART